MPLNPAAPYPPDRRRTRLQGSCGFNAAHALTATADSMLVLTMLGAQRAHRLPFRALLRVAAKVATQSKHGIGAVVTLRATHLGAAFAAPYSNVIFYARTLHAESRRKVAEANQHEGIVHLPKVDARQRT